MSPEHKPKWESFGWRYRIECDKDRRIERVFQKYDSGGDERVWFVRPDSRSIDTIVRDFEDYLVQHVPETIRALQFKHPTCAIMLCYCGGDLGGIYLSYIVAVTPEVRQATRDKWGLSGAWNADDLIDVERGRREFEFCSPEKREEFTAQELQFVYKVRERRDSSKIMIDTLRRVARRLNDLDWSAICPITDDFVVVAADNTGNYGYLNDALASMTREQLRTLRRTGWLPSWFKTLTYRLGLRYLDDE